MFSYYLLFIIPAVFALTRIQINHVVSSRWPVSWWFIFLVLTLIIGMRHEVGADWEQYLLHIDEVRNVPFEIALGGKDPASSIINWLAGHWGEVYLVNTLCGALFAFGLIKFCRTQPLPWLALVVAIPYLVIVVAMGYTRQGVAIGIAMMALVALDKGSVIRFLCWIAVAALFHKSAVILVPLAILANTKRKLWMFLWIGIVGSTLFVLLLQESLDFLTYSYLEQDRYESSGAAIRIGMNALPGLIFLIFHHRFAMSIAQKRLWMWIAAIALVFVGLLYVSPSSTAVDRVALYLIPLQLFVLSRIPLAIGNSFGGKYVWVCLMVAYSATVQTVWLLMGDMANSWLPYRFYLWELIWQ